MVEEKNLRKTIKQRKLSYLGHIDKYNLIQRTLLEDRKWKEKEAENDNEILGVA